MKSRVSPYQGLSKRNFWKTGVAEAPLAVGEIYQKRFQISTTDKVMTAGSCFAQHISAHMRKRGFNMLDVEPAPPGLREEEARAFGYGLYSARYGNIYTARQLLQLLKEAAGEISLYDHVWETNGRYFDAFRPSVEPDGLDSIDEVRAHRAHHLSAVGRLIEEVDVLVFTLGLTETWTDRHGVVYPTAPGTISGTYHPSKYIFKNLSFNENLMDLREVMDFMMTIRPHLKILLTVSPVPLTATASSLHILPATIYSKSVLRAVAGEIYNTFENVDYFPSYEIIASHASRGSFFEDNLRSVTTAGIDTVMSSFFGEHCEFDQSKTRPTPSSPSPQSKRRAFSAVCEDELLEAFQK